MKKESTIFERSKSNIYLVVFDRYRKNYYTHYYDTEFEKDQAKRKFYFSTRYLVVEDSTDRFWDD